MTDTFTYHHTFYLERTQSNRGSFMELIKLNGSGRETPFRDNSLIESIRADGTGRETRFGNNSVVESKLMEVLERHSSKTTPQ